MMQTSKLYYIRIFKHIESVCCECAEAVLSTNVRPEVLYSDRKPTLATSVARGIAFMIMHDFYGIRYSVIAWHARMNVNSIIHKVISTRTYVYSSYYGDSIYKNVHSLVMEKL